MILEEPDKSFGRDSKSWHSARCFLPQVRLALEKISVLRGGDELLGPAPVICVIGFVTAGQSDHRAVVHVIVPESVEIVAAFAARPNKLGFLRLIFRDQDDRPIAGGEACR